MGESKRKVMRELGRMFYKERERERHSFSVHERIRGNETDRDTERVNGELEQGKQRWRMRG